MVVVGMVPSEFPRSFCVPKRAWPRLLRTFSSKPGKEARCFLNGEATLLSTSAVAAVDEEPSAAVLPGAGVPEIGDPDDESPAGGPRARGSAECCRFSCHHVSRRKHYRLVKQTLIFRTPSASSPCLAASSGESMPLSMTSLSS